MVAEFEWGGVGAEFDGLDLGGPVLVEEDVVDAVETDCALLNSLDGGMVLRWKAQCGAITEFRKVTSREELPCQQLVRWGLSKVATNALNDH